MLFLWPVLGLFVVLVPMAAPELHDPPALFCGVNRVFTLCGIGLL